MEEENKDSLDDARDKQTPEQVPEETPTEGTVFKEKESKVGPVIGAIIVILIIVVGGIYFWSVQIEESRPSEQSEEMIGGDQFSEPAEDPIEEANQIQKELDDLNLEDIDAELDAIDAEFDAI
jgi:uncharacterized protein HemX